MEIPKYTPQRTVYSRVENKKYYRNTSSNFAKKARKYILDRDGEICARCGLTKNLQIDHIVSVYLGYKHNVGLFEINHVDNLQVLCRSCNAGKSPDEVLRYRGE